MKKMTQFFGGAIAIILLIATATIPAVLSRTNINGTSAIEENFEMAPIHGAFELNKDLYWTQADSSNLDDFTVASNGDIQITSFDEDVGHPDVTLDGTGNPVVMYDHESVDFYSEIFLQRSFDGGSTWPLDQAYYLAGSEDISAIFPHVDIMDDGIRGVATFKLERGEPIIYFIEMADMEDPGTWLIWSLDVSGTTDYVGEVSIAGHGSTSLVMPNIRDYRGGDYDLTETLMIYWTPDITTLEDEGVNGVFWIFDDGEGQTRNCQAATGGDRMYAVCELFNPSNPARTQLFAAYAPADAIEYTEWTGNRISYGNTNLTHPKIAVSGNNRYIVAENDRNGNQDVLCYTQTGGMWRRHTVADSADDERYPSISADGQNAICTFVKNGNLYMSKSEDGGNTWSEPDQINDNDGTVVGDYRCSDIEGPYMVWTDNRDAVDTIYFDVGTVPLVGISSVSGGFGITATIENSGTADAEDIYWSITVDAPLMLIGGSANGTISTLAVGGTEQVKSGFMLGFGSGTITVMADDAIATSSGFVLGPLVLNVT